MFDLVAYAQEHRFRLRNLHDGGPVPPARRRKSDALGIGYIGSTDRWDSIVGYDGYVAMGGSELSVCLFYKSARGVKSAIRRLTEIGARIDQVGDTEMGATVPVDRIEEVLRLIRVSKVPLRNPGGNPEWQRDPVSDAARGAESHETALEAPGPSNAK